MKNLIQKKKSISVDNEDTIFQNRSVSHEENLNIDTKTIAKDVDEKTESFPGDKETESVGADLGDDEADSFGV